MIRFICLILYYGFARFLPPSDYPIVGNISKKIRFIICKKIFRKCGNNVNIEYKAYFGTGKNIEIGDYSNMGINCVVPNDTIIGNYVMMGPNCYIFAANHQTKSVDIPMCFQGHTDHVRTVIGDDVWIGQDVLILPGRHINNHMIIAAGCVLCKSYPEYSVVGGNPSRVLKVRK